MDVKQSIKFAGQWTGDFGMYYTYRYRGQYLTFDSYDTDIVFYPEFDGATYGYGKQVDYYEHGPYSYIYNSFVNVSSTKFNDVKELNYPLIP